MQAVKAEASAVGLRRLWYAVPRGGVDCFSDSFELEHSGLVIGNEAQGIEDSDIEEKARVSIPMPGDAESLNVAQAATVLLFEGLRRGGVHTTLDGAFDAGRVGL